MSKSEIVISNDRVYHLGLRKGELATNIFLVGDPARAYKVADFFDTIQSEVKHREYVTITGAYQGIPISVMGTGIGTDNVEIALVEIYTLLEFDFETKEKIGIQSPVNIIRIGTSGGVQADIPAGTMGIARYALGMDSTGLYYNHPAIDQTVDKIEKRANEILFNATDNNARFKGKILTYASKASTLVTDTLIDVANHKNIPFVSGITASSPGFYGPSARVIHGLENSIPNIKQVLSTFKVDNNRVINMEMESSLIFHLCTPLSYHAGTICPVISNPYSSDNLIDYDQTIRQAIEIALQTMVKLNR